MHVTLVLVMYAAGASIVGFTHGLHIAAGAYEDLVVELTEEMPAEHCSVILSKLEETLLETSKHLYTALEGRAYLRSVSVLLPDTWPNSCAPRAVGRSAGRASDVSVVRDGDGRVWTRQPAGCGQPGDQVFITRANLLHDTVTVLSYALLRQFIKYRYGVFDERGFLGDPIYPLCYDKDAAISDVNTDFNVTGCSDRPLHGTHNVCNGSAALSNALHPDARTSLMFTGTISHLCDENTHDSRSPTKHNFMCNRRSILEIVLENEDFATATVKPADPGVFNKSLRVSYEKRTLTRYMLVIEDTRQMSQRESWSFLRTAVRKWAVHDLLNNSEVSLMMANESAASMLLPLTPMHSTDARVLVSSNLPYAPSDSRAAACLQCALRSALAELRAATRTQGPAAQVVVLVAPGTDQLEPLVELARDARKAGVRIVTINYPGVLRTHALDQVAMITGAPAYTVFERRHNIDKSLLTTYFDLTNVLRDVAARFHEGGVVGVPLELYRHRMSDDGRDDGPAAVITSSFVLDPGVGEPARFALYAHDMDAPLVRGLTLTSPSGRVYTSRSDALVSVKAITLATTLNETGTWTYRVERYPGNPQPHFVQVTASARNPSSGPVVHARLWLNQELFAKRGVFVVHALLIYGTDRPVLGANVLLTVNTFTSDGSLLAREQFPLLDSGSGDPDTTRGDGVYSRYFAPAHAGSYTFEAVATDNGNTAYCRHPDNDLEMSTDECCGGGVINAKRVQPLSPFQRVLPSAMVTVSEEQMAMFGRVATLGRVGDLRVLAVLGEARVRLSWTAPDTAGRRISRYDLRYGSSVDQIFDRFEDGTTAWEYGSPLPLATGSEMTFTLDFTKEPKLFGQALYLALRPILQDGVTTAAGPVSNWVRVQVPEPQISLPPAIEVPTTWPHDGGPVAPTLWMRTPDGGPDASPAAGGGRDTGPELRLALIAVGVLLAALLAVLCVCCIARRRSAQASATNKTIREPPPPALKMTVDSPPPPATVAVISANHLDDVTTNSADGDDDELKKRFSYVHQQEQQMSEDLRQYQHHLHNLLQPTIPAPATTGTLGRRQRALSPYESWTASQLLHEHERRYSPVDEEEQASMSHYGTTGPPLLLQLQPPPVPPLPIYEGYSASPPGYVAYGALGTLPHPLPMDVSLHGSASSVGSGERRRRNVTMV